MNTTRMGVLLCSSLPLLCWFVESIAELFAASATSQSLLDVSEDNMLKALEDDVSTAANVAAQKHFRQNQHMFQVY